MEKKRMIGKSLKPARPVRHLCSHAASFPTVSAISFSFQPKFPCSSPLCLNNEINSMYKSKGMLVFNGALLSGLPEQNKPEVTKERITYSRDFLLKLSEVSLAQKKPEFLPDHPIVLEKPKKYYLLPTSSDGRSL
uniref:Uncharacterized protein C8orf88 homolog isoform X1 n=1 Tax=Pogona vitticeps TaxID=103695 RepID=A0A6J0VFH5_9SAUR|nr:uncharacterized protein C8orf88 homolog isoform X1 [Pogona vitticeps]XP_020669443.1 uncharacterized protein C8orf88 homolog isoform X1 [Pogona vitticeps]XP_020669444.1 uncharacterized protein C8orf88 homolog isoform X1 [Pogona vitticeps]